MDEGIFCGDFLQIMRRFSVPLPCNLHPASLPPPQFPQDASSPTSDAKAAPWWKAKKWALHIAYRLFSRYGVTKQCKEGNDKAFSEMFVVRVQEGRGGGGGEGEQVTDREESRKGSALLTLITPPPPPPPGVQRDCMSTFLDAHLQLLSWVATGTYMSPRCLNLIFQVGTREGGRGKWKGRGGQRRGFGDPVVDSSHPHTSLSPRFYAPSPASSSFPRMPFRSR